MSAEPVSTPEGLSMEVLAEGKRLRHEAAAPGRTNEKALAAWHYWVDRNNGPLIDAAEAVPGLEAENARLREAAENALRFMQPQWSATQRLAAALSDPNPEEG